MRLRAMKKQSQNKPNFRNAKMNVNFFVTKDYENESTFRVRKNKAKTKPICQRVKLMQSVYLQRIMKKNADRGYEKTKPKQSQNKPNTNPIFPKIKTISFLNFLLQGRIFFNHLFFLGFFELSQFFAKSFVGQS